VSLHFLASPVPQYLGRNADGCFYGSVELYLVLTPGEDERLRTISAAKRLGAGMIPNENAEHTGSLDAQNIIFEKQ
jgi:hypothetical protein